MSYQSYVIAAYLVFVTVLLWDFVVSNMQIRRQMRADKLRVARETARAPPDQ